MDNHSLQGLPENMTDADHCELIQLIEHNMYIEEYGEEEEEEDIADIVLKYISHVAFKEWIELKNYSVSLVKSKIEENLRERLKNKFMVNLTGAVV